MSTQMQFTLGDALRKSRTEPVDGPRLSQEYMAAKLDVSRPTIGAWESGRQDPPFPAVVEWSRLTGWPLEWFESTSPRMHAPTSSVQLSLLDAAERIRHSLDFAA